VELVCGERVECKRGCKILCDVWYVAAKAQLELSGREIEDPSPGLCA
jgi:hypothetical protein